MFKLNQKGDFFYYTIPSFEETGLVKHGFTTRAGGVSSGCYKSLNLRFHCEDKRENVLENFRIAAEMFGMDFDRLILSKQVHEDVIQDVSSADFGNGIAKENKRVSIKITDNSLSIHMYNMWLSYLNNTFLVRYPKQKTVYLPKRKLQHECLVRRKIYGAV